MEAKETEEDSTRAEGCETYLLYQAPPGECVGVLSHGAVDELIYQDFNDAGDRTGVNIEMFPVSFKTGPGGCL